ncbi:receptor-like protein 7, partial [Quercus suber]
TPWHELASTPPSSRQLDIIALRYPCIMHDDVIALRFVDQIPPEILQLSKLDFLALTGNDLKLQKPSLKSLVENLPRLKHLYLGFVNISSTVPHILANLSSLMSLGLTSCGLYGEFPIEVFRLPNLEILIVRGNENLTGHLPEFQSSSPLQILRLADTSFSGKLPNSLGSLTNLTELVEFDLVLKLKYLTQLSLSGVHLSFPINSTFNASIPKLQVLILRECNLTEFPIFLRYQNELEFLDLSNNKIHGQIPKWMFNVGKETLSYLSLELNLLTGKLPSEHFQSWTSMKVAKLKFERDNVFNSSYMIALTITKSANFTWYGYFIIMMGYGSGLINGVVIGNKLTIRKLGWFLKNFGKK